MYTKFRPWKQAKGFRRADASGENAEASQPGHTINPAEKGKVSCPALQFVNTSHPRDATSVEVIGTIRSHVAKEIHATRRQKKRIATQARYEAKTRKKETKSPASSTQEIPECGDNLDTIFGAVYEPDSRGRPAELPSPATLLDSARRDKLNLLARPLNDAESFLIDHYLTIVAPEAFNINDEVAAKVGSAWVPFALSDTGLLSSLLLITCRCLELLSSSDLGGSTYDGLAVRYKGDCLSLIRAALREEGNRISTTTIARVMVMCSYEIKFGDSNTARCHAKAIGKMIEIKGGIETVSNENYAGQVIARFCAKLGAWSDNTLALPPAVHDYE